MPSPKRRIAIFLARTILILVIVITAVLYSLTAVIAYDTVSAAPDRLPRITPSGAFEDVTFPARGQAYRVYGFYVPGTGRDQALINVHGFKNSRYVPYQIDRAQALRDLGYTVLSIDLSDSAGDTVATGRTAFGYRERWDVLGAFDYLLSRGFAASRIGLVGESMGAATNLLAAAQEPRIRAVWADSAYTDAPTVLADQAALKGIPAIVMPGGIIAGFLIAGDRLWEAAPIQAAAGFAAHHQAVYLIHCRNDHTVLFHHGVELDTAYRAAGVNVTFWPVDDGDHVSAILNHRAEYLARLDHFFQTNLG